MAVGCQAQQLRVVVVQRDLGRIPVLEMYGIFVHLDKVP